MFRTTDFCVPDGKSTELARDTMRTESKRNELNRIEPLFSLSSYGTTISIGGSYRTTNTLYQYARTDTIATVLFWSEVRVTFHSIRIRVLACSYMYAHVYVPRYSRSSRAEAATSSSAAAERRRRAAAAAGAPGHHTNHWYTHYGSHLIARYIKAVYSTVQLCSLSENEHCQLIHVVARRREIEKVVVVLKKLYM